MPSRKDGSSGSVNRLGGFFERLREGWEGSEQIRFQMTLPSRNRGVDFHAHATVDWRPRSTMKPGSPMRARAQAEIRENLRDLAAEVTRAWPATQLQRVRTQLTARFANPGAVGDLELLRVE